VTAVNVLQGVDPVGSGWHDGRLSLPWRSGHDRIGFLAPGEIRVWGLGLTQANAAANAAGV
jgi:hypothetical protein